MTNLSKHPLLRQCWEVMCQIEKCGASVELTKAVTMAGELLAAIDKHVTSTGAPTNLASAVLELNRAWNAKDTEPVIAEHLDLCRRLANAALQQPSQVDSPSPSGQPSTVRDADLHAWLLERERNALRIAIGKDGEDRLGWLEDASYFGAAADAVARAVDQAAEARKP